MAATARAVDLTNVKEGGNFRPRRKPEGDYRAKIVKADDHTPKKDGSLPGWVLTIQVEGDARSTYPYYLNPDPKQAWKIGGICRAAGLNVKNARIRFDPNKLVNKAIGIALEDDEYEGREKSSIADVFTVDEVGGNADEDIPEDDEEVIEDDEVEIPEDDDEDEEPIEEEPEPAPVKRTTAVKGTRTVTKRAPEPEPVEDDELDDDDDEPAPVPAPRKRVAVPAKKAAPRKVAPVVEDEDDDLDELDTDDLD